jgi:IMP dehydrogenase
MVVNPITISPEATLGDLKEIKAKHRISGIPVVDAGGKLVGIVTNRDVRFEEDLNRKVGDLMTRKLVTVKEGVDQSEARKLLHEHRIEKLIVVDDDFKCTGLITVTDMDKAACTPTPSRTSKAACASPLPPARVKETTRAPKCWSMPRWTSW